MMSLRVCFMMVVLLICAMFEPVAHAMDSPTDDDQVTSMQSQGADYSIDIETNTETGGCIEQIAESQIDTLLSETFIGSEIVGEVERLGGQVLNIVGRQIYEGNAETVSGEAWPSDGSGVVANHLDNKSNDSVRHQSRRDWTVMLWCISDSNFDAST